MGWGNGVRNLEVKRLYRSRGNRMVAGVCGGLGEYFDIDPTTIRLGWVFLILAGGFGLIAYVLAMVIMPERGKEEPIEEFVLHLPGLELILVLFGVFILVVGVIQLFTNLIPWPFLDLMKWTWPLVLTALGIILILIGLSRSH